MMKKFKKISTLFLTMAMVLGMSVSVFAADGDTQTGKGTITVENTSATVGKYQQSDSGTLKYDSTKEKYVEIKAGEDVPEAQRFEYVQVDNTYKAYRIFQASPANDGDDKTAPTTTWKATETNNHVSYTATPAQVAALTGKAVGALGDSETGANSCFNFTKTAAGDYLVELASGITAKDVAQYFNANIATLTSEANAATFPATTLTVNGGKASASVDYGYYFVTSSNGSVVSIDTTNKNVVINDKNTYGDPFNPGDDDDPSNNDLKNITKINGQTNTNGHDNTTANIGDILTYEIKNNTSNYVVVEDGGTPTSKKVNFVYVNDTIGKGLKYYVNDTYKFTVKVGTTELTKSEEPFNYQDKNALKYYITEKAEKTGDAYDGDAFTVIIPWLDANGNPVFADNAVVTVTYSAQLDEYVEEVTGQDAGGNSSNSANIKYDLTDPDDEPGPENPPTPTPGQGGSNTGVKEDEVKVLVYAIAIQKYDGADMSKLEGAHFEVTDPDGNVIVAKALAGTEKRYMFDSTKQKEYSTANPKTVPAGYTKDFVTNSDGQIIIYGVKGGTYTVKETTAPSGYNLMKDTADIDASVAGENVTTTTMQVVTYFVQNDEGTYKKDGDKFVEIPEAELTTIAATDRYAISETKTENVNVDATFTASENVAYVGVENNKGSELPSTGGMGTTLFYLIGAALVIGAGVLLVTRRRMSAQ